MTQSFNIRKFSVFAVIAAIVNSIIFLVAQFADATMVVNQGGIQKIVLPMVVGASLVSIVLAASIASQIGKKSEGFLSKSPILGLVFGVVSAVAPFIATDDSKTALALASMHVVAGVVWYIGAKSSLQ
jgi:Family of unknown function (DUF6069)